MVSEITKKFNEYLAQSDEIQQQLRLIKSPLDLINIAKKEGFELSIKDFQELANQAYQDWLSQLNPQVRLFFEKVHSTPDLHNKLQQCNCVNDLLILADQCHFNLTEDDLKQAANIAESIPGFSFEKLFFQHLGMI
jgi:hypothetical protein